MRKIMHFFTKSLHISKKNSTFAVELYHHYGCRIVDISGSVHDRWHSRVYHSGITGDADCLCRSMACTDYGPGGFQLADVAHLGNHHDRLTGA